MSATDEAQELTGGHMSLIEHLTELRSRLIKCVIAVAVGAVIVWIFYDPILTFLKAPLDEADPNARLILTDPLQGLATRFKVSGYGVSHGTSAAECRTATWRCFARTRSRQTLVAIL